MKVAIGELLVAAADCHADHEPVPVAAPVEDATGVLLETKVDDDHALQLALLVATGVWLEEVATAGVVLHEVEVLVQTGTETVHGQSVTVKVVLAVIV